MKLQAPVTKTIILANCLIYVVQMLLTSDNPLFQKYILMTFSLSPAWFWEGSIWQIITFGFFHGGFFHLFVNMLGIFSIGRFVESTIGSREYTALYFFSLFFSGLFVVLSSPSSHVIPTVGASGALLGLLSAFALFYPKARVSLIFFPVSAMAALAWILGVSVFFMVVETDTIFSRFSHSGHIGGLVGGFIFIRVKQYLAFKRSKSVPFS